MFVSETYNIEDCNLYRASVSGSENFNLSLPSKFKISADFLRNRQQDDVNYSFFQIYNGNTLIYDVGMLRGKGSLSIRRTADNYMVADNNSSIVLYNQLANVVYTYNEGTQSLSANNVTINGTDTTTITTFNQVYIEKYTVTNLKVKLL